MHAYHRRQRVSSEPRQYVAHGDPAGVRRSLFCCLTLLLTFLAGCASSVGGPSDPAVYDSEPSIYVVRRGWHTGIVIAVEEWPNRNWSLLADFPEAEYLEFGWGDERYYQAERNTFWLGMRAAVWPTSSVIHVIGLRAPVATTARADEVIRVPISTASLREIARSIELEFVDENPQATGVELASEPSPNWFYRAKRSFYFPRMCNWWIATHLRQAECPVQPWTVITASRVMREARECALPSVPNFGTCLHASHCRSGQP